MLIPSLHLLIQPSVFQGQKPSDFLIASKYTLLHSQQNDAPLVPLCQTCTSTFEIKVSINCLTYLSYHSLRESLSFPNACSFSSLITLPCFSPFTFIIIHFPPC